MPYNANSKAKQQVRLRMDATEAGVDPDDASGRVVGPLEPTQQQAQVLVELASGQSLRAANAAVVGNENSGVYATAVVTSDRVQRTMPRALEKRGLTADGVARHIAREVRKMRSPDVAERALAFKALTLACKLRGDLVPPAPSASGGPPPVAINMLIQVMRELQEPQALVVEALDNTDVNGHAPQPTDKVE